MVEDEATGPARRIEFESDLGIDRLIEELGIAFGEDAEALLAGKLGVKAIPFGGNVEDGEERDERVFAGVFLEPRGIDRGGIAKLGRVVFFSVDERAEKGD